MSNTVPFRDVRRKLEEAGYTLARIAKGSHHIFTKAGALPISIPVHNEKVKRVYQRKIDKALKENNGGNAS